MSNVTTISIDEELRNEAKKKGISLSRWVSHKLREELAQPNRTEEGVVVHRCIYCHADVPEHEYIDQPPYTKCPRCDALSYRDWKIAGEERSQLNVAVMRFLVGGNEEAWKKLPEEAQKYKEETKNEKVEEGVKNA